MQKYQETCGFVDQININNKEIRNNIDNEVLSKKILILYIL